MVYSMVRSGINLNFTKLARAQEQVATGKRILTPSDDPAGASAAMALRRQAGHVDAYLSAAGSVRPLLSAASGQLQEASTLLADARSTILAGLNGTLNASDRESLAIDLELAYQSLLEISNATSGDRYLFSGTTTDTEPFVEVLDQGRRSVRYAGNDGQHSVLVGRGVDVRVNVPGNEIFAKFEPSGVGFLGTSGVQQGATVSSGTGYHELHFRHDATSGVLGAGLALANGGADDTILGAHTLVVNATDGTVRLGSGTAVDIPSPLPAALEVFDADGSSVVIDFSGWTGVDDTTVLTGSGSVALNDGPYQAITLAETDLELIDDARGVVLHLDTTGVTRATDDLVTFEGTANVFDTILGAIADLRNADGHSTDEVFERLSRRLSELDRNQDNLLVGMSTLGAREARVDSTENRLRDLDVHLQSVLSNIEDADLAEVVLDLNRAEQTLQVAQATGARLIQQSLLNFLR